MFQSMNNEREGLLKQLITLVYFMRGAIKYEESKNMTKLERKLAEEFIESRLEVESKKVYPNY